MSGRELKFGGANNAGSAIFSGYGQVEFDAHSAVIYVGDGASHRYVRIDKKRTTKDGIDALNR